ncbi:hypothetical protein EXIGLDRAFT_726012 [Exidia glandulosa HHB12029]|uniref:Uncharacterized protein n=1 Tax=Exidia glandulosa HHB12029 TaxID=1314781 RepID=A0A165DWY9_EXIGL|nr:hypothetical protein EXIGLDRAFT_726012 [Exidia glandulosa HHB12029]
MHLKAFYVCLFASSLSFINAAPWLREGGGELLPACSFKRDPLGRRECEEESRGLPKVPSPTAL